MAVQIDLKYTVNLNRPMQVEFLPTLLFTGDDHAHRFIITAMRGEQAENLTGSTIKGYVIRGDNATHELDGEVDADGRAVLVLDETSYAAYGRMQVAIRAIKDDVKTVIFAAEGGIHRVTSDSIVDPENVVPSLSDLLEQIEKMEQATADANAAAKRANEAADNAGGGTGGGTGSGLPAVTTEDNDKSLYVSEGAWKVSKLPKNAVEGLVTDFINIYGLFDAKDAAIAEKADKVHTHAYSEITDKPDTFLTEADKQDIVNDTLSALAGADTSNAPIAALQSLVNTHDRKIGNMAKDLGTLQANADALEITFVAMIHPTPVLDDPDTDKMTFMYTSRVLDVEENETLYDDITLLSPTGDVYAGKGIEGSYTRKKLATEEYVQEAMILTAPNGNKFRLTVDNNGSLSTVAVE